MQGSLSDTPVYSGPLRRNGVPSSKNPARGALRTERYQRYAPCALHALYFLFVVCFWQIVEDPAATLYACGAVGTLVYGALAFVELRRSPLFVSPLSALFVWYLPPIGPSAIHFANKIIDGEPMPFSVKMLQPSDVAAGYVIMILGNLAMHLGLQWTRPLVSNTTVKPDTANSQPITLLALWGTSIAVRVAAKFVVSLGAIVGVIHFGSTAALASFLLSYDPKKRGILFWTILVLGTAVEFVTNLGSGSKAYLMFSFLPVLWLFLRDQKLRKFIPFLSVAMFAFYVGVIAPVVMTSRMLRRTTTESETSTDRIVEAFTRGDYEAEAGTDKQLPKYLERAFDATASACIYGEVQKTGFMWGEGMDYLVYAFIPRILWPEKPTITRGAWFSVYLGQARTEEKATTSLGQTAAGELFWNFGWGGVFLGLTVLGAMCGRLWRLATPYAETDALRLLLYFGITFTVTHMAEAGSTFIALVYRAAALGIPIVLLDHARVLAIKNRIINS